MKKWFRAGGILALMIALSGCGYNLIQQQEEAVFKAWADVESNLQRRADLIPNLVQTVKGYAAHERETLQSVVEARVQATRVQISADDLSDPAAMERLSQVRGSSLQPCPGSCWWWSATRTSRPVRIFYPFRTSWKGPKTGSMWPGCGITRRLKPSTAPSASFLIT